MQFSLWPLPSTSPNHSSQNATLQTRRSVDRNDKVGNSLTRHQTLCIGCSGASLSSSLSSSSLLHQLLQREMGNSGERIKISSHLQMQSVRKMHKECFRLLRCRTISPTPSSLPLSWSASQGKQRLLYTWTLPLQKERQREQIGGRYLKETFQKYLNVMNVHKWTLGLGI